jgi:hypothetical protein
MPAIRSITAVAALIATLSLAPVPPARAALGDAEVIIYRFPGVRDNGGADNTGVTTSFHCTNFSGVPETIRIVVRDFDGTLKANVPFVVIHLATLTASTHSATLYSDAVLTTGVVAQGTAAIAATSINVICTAVTLDAASASPNGFALRGIRFSPVPGSQE